MRITFLIIIILTVICDNGYSQQREIPIVNFIKRLQREVRENEEEKTRLEKLSSRYLAQLDIEKSKNNRNQKEINLLHENLNNTQILVQKYTSLFASKLDSLRYTYSIIDTLKTDNIELQSILAAVRMEHAKVKQENDKKTATVFDLQRDAELLALMLSKFNTYELGYYKSGKLEVTKIYDNSTINTEDKGIAFRNPDLFSNRLDVFNCTGTLYLPKNKSFGQNISGEILIYVNDKLGYRLKDNLKLKIDNIISSVECYEVDFRKQVNFSFPSKANIRVAFIDDITLKNLSNDDLINYWECERKGYFLISSLKSSFKLNTLSHSALIKNSTIIDSVLVRSSKIKLGFFDSGSDDGDIASFYINGVLKVEDLLIKSIGKKIEVTLNDNVSILTLIASSQGDIPPCTALVVIYENDKEVGLIKLSGSQFKSQSLKIIRTNK